MTLYLNICSVAVKSSIFILVTERSGLTPVLVSIPPTTNTEFVLGRKTADANAMGKLSEKYTFRILVQQNMIDTVSTSY